MRVNVLDLPNKPHAHAGQVLDLPEAEAKDMITRGTATAAPDEPPAELPSDPPTPAPEPELAHDDPAPAPTAKPKKKARAPRTPKRG